jgi:hypothetical protein
MKVALIPPAPELRRHATTDIHLLLSHLFERPGYIEYYRNRRRAGDYLILDNSAHEHGHGNKAQELLFQAMIIGVHEVVCSDVLFDSQGTCEATEGMLQYITSDHGWDAYMAAGLPRLMLVPQGRSERELEQCLNRLMYLWAIYMENLSGHPPVIGISKDYDDDLPGGIASFISTYCHPHRERVGADVHCLGWPANLWALADVYRKAPWVRSVDSAKPFVYARAGIRLEPGGTVPTYPHRTDDYFDAPLGRCANIAKANVEVFKAAATDALIEDLASSMH